MNHNLPYQHYSVAVRQLRPLFPTACPWLEPDAVKVADNTPTGAGGFADIWKGTFDGRSVIQKSYRCHESCTFEHTFPRYLKEVWVLTQLSHANVVRFVGVNPTPRHPFGLVLDTADHLSLREYLDENPEAGRLKLVRGIARGLKYLHDQGIIHGHLTSHNILVDPDGTPCIAGFGSSFMISRPDLWSESDVGPHRHSAPELMRPRNRGEPAVQMTKASDIYAFGMLTREIFSGRDAFPRDPYPTVVYRVLKGDRPSQPDHPELSDRVWKMMKRSWNDSPSRRMTVGDLVALIEAEYLVSVRPPVPDLGVSKNTQQATRIPSHPTFRPFFACFR